MERRALYNSLRLNWKRDPNIQVQPWQIENYRSLTVDQLFEGMKSLGITLDRSQFATMSDEVDTPEELTELVIPEGQISEELGDRIYLYIFEIWRRIVPEKQSITLLCDELDHQISLYDAEATTVEGIEDTLGHLQMLLREHEDEGGEPKQLFSTISHGCAHDLEGFLYDYIATQIDNRNFTYALDLLETFLPYVGDSRWFEYLLAQAVGVDDSEAYREKMHELIKDTQKHPDLEFQLELLSNLAKSGEEKTFLQLVKQTSPALEFEEDFWDLLLSVMDYFHFKDDEKTEQLLAAMGQRRTEKFPPDAPLSQEDPDLKTVLQLLR